ncbi:MAG: LysR family transcriptional regulator [Oscillospiraceae bacterium]|nr:LysR family transcriptional regulator [Oscillospiraceae bacterium]
MLYQRIKCFLEVANCLSFSTAAKNLYISQQAVTRQIAALEGELGLKLFYRTTRQVALTPAGSVLRDDFTQVNRQIDDSIRRARALDASGKDLLRVGFLSALSQREIILPVADYLMKHRPEYELDIRLLDVVELRNRMLDGRLDLCVTTSNDWRLWPGVEGTVLQKKQFQVVYSTRHPLARCGAVTLEALAQHTQLILPHDYLLEGVELWGRKVPYQRAVSCPDFRTLMVRLALGEGFALLTKVLEGHDDPSLCYWDLPFPEAHAEIVCLRRENDREEIQRIISDIQLRNLVQV